MKGTRQLLLTLLATLTAVLLASGVAIAQEINGTTGDDVLDGTAQEDSDSIHGKDGNDDIQGMGGSDKVVGDAGDDTLYGADEAGSVQTGNDKVFGEGGNDELLGGPGTDTLHGGPGEDFILGGPAEADAPNEVYGGDDDYISVVNNPASKETIIDCGSGVDTVEADSLDVVKSNCENVIVVPVNADPDSAPPNHDPNAPDIVDEPLETTTTTADGSPTAQDVAGSGCYSRRDTPHASSHAVPRYSEILAKVGVWRCGYKKKSIYVDTLLQKYAGVWYTVRRIRDTDFNVYANVETLAFRCSPSLGYYRSVLYDAVMRDYDGDVHYMLFSRYSYERADKCIPYS